MIILTIRYLQQGDLDMEHHAVLKCSDCCSDLAVVKATNLPDAIGKSVAGYLHKFGREPRVEALAMHPEQGLEVFVELNAVFQPMPTVPTEEPTKVKVPKPPIKAKEKPSE